jgi:large subunit ribosomal protein L2
MTIRIYKKTSAGRRNASVNMHTEVTKRSPEKSLLQPKPKTGGRNNHGVITQRHIGGGAKQAYRQIDFKRNKFEVEGTVVGIEYDPNRSSNIALVKYADDEVRYIIAPVGLTDNDKIISSKKAAEPKAGNSMPLKFIPSGLNVHCVELIAGQGGKLCRSAGTYARLTNKEAGWATLVFPSGEIRQVSVECLATIGQVGNSDHQNVKLGKAGRNRHKGVRPTVRGMAMTHECHPMGGGSGRSKGNRPPSSPTGVLAKGGKTRKPDKASNKRIIRRRFSKRYGQLVL